MAITLVNRKILTAIMAVSFTSFLVAYTIYFKVKFVKKDNPENTLEHIVHKLNAIEQVLNQYSMFAAYKEFRAKIEVSIPKIIKKKSDEINPHVLIEPVKGDIHQKYKLLVLVSSNTPHDIRRQSIRNAWANKQMWSTKEAFKVLFVVGVSKDMAAMNKLNIECEKYGDVLLEDIEESFYHLSLKVMTGLQWSHTNMNYDYILKCDDDIFIQMDRLMLLLEHHKNSDYIGQVMINQPVMRNGRYGLTKAEHPNDIFDPYCSGGAFIISFNTVHSIIPLFDWFSPLKIDDAYLGHLVCKANIKSEHEDGFHFWNRWCEYTNVLIVSHPVTEDKCMNFMTAKSMIENGKLVNDTIKDEKYAFDEKTRNQL